MHKRALNDQKKRLRAFGVFRSGILFAIKFNFLVFKKVISKLHPDDDISTWP